MSPCSIFDKFTPARPYNSSTISWELKFDEHVPCAAPAHNFCGIFVRKRGVLWNHWVLRSLDSKCTVLTYTYRISIILSFSGRETMTLGWWVCTVHTSGIILAVTKSSYHAAAVIKAVSTADIWHRNIEEEYRQCQQYITIRDYKGHVITIANAGFFATSVFCCQVSLSTDCFGSATDSQRI